MANTFSQIYLQFVFAVQDRRCLIKKQFKEDLHKYTTSLVNARTCKMLAVNCMPDHTHLFVGFKPSVLISGFIKEIKVGMNDFINDKQWCLGKFSWQEGYGVFSYGQSQIDRVCKYIFNQEQHHKKRTFRTEYIELLDKFQIPYNDRYLFRWIE